MPTPAPAHAADTPSPSIPLKERVFALACQGMRSPAIAQTLNVPERTVRAWMQKLRDEVADERKATRRTDLALAIERQLAISAAAWQGYERAALAEQHLILRLDLTEVDDDPLPFTRLSGVGARYLSVAQSAQREAARLQALYDMPEELEEPQQLPFLVINAPPTTPDALPPEDRDVWDAFMAWRRAHAPDDPTPFTYSPHPQTSPSPSSASSRSARDAAALAAAPSVVQAAAPSPETEKPAETATFASDSLDVRDLPGVQTYPPDLANPAPVTPQLRRHLTARSEVIYLPAPMPAAVRRNGRPAARSRAPRLGIPPPHR